MVEAVSYPMVRMTHPSRNFFVLSLFCVLCMFVWLRVQGFESSVNKVFQKKKLVNSKTKIYIPNLEAELSSDNWQKSPI